MSKNYTMAQAADIFRYRNDMNSLVDITKRFPLTALTLSQLEGAGYQICLALPDYVTVRKVEKIFAEMNNVEYKAKESTADIKAKELSDEIEGPEEVVEEPKKKKQTGFALKKKKKEKEVVDDLFEGNEEDVDEEDVKKPNAKALDFDFDFDDK